MMKKKNKNQMIRHAIDSYPGGLCFSRSDGRIILANEKINELILKLSGHTMLNAVTTWKELSEISASQRFNSEEQHRLFQHELLSSEADAEQLLIQQNDQSVWRFEYLKIGEDIMQLEAADITELYQLYEKLYDNSIRLLKMQERRNNLLDDIVQMNKKKEILNTKMHVHDAFGQCLLATEKALAENMIEESCENLKTNWNDCIRSFLHVKKDSMTDEDTEKQELIHVAQLIGCRIVLEGTPPHNSAVRHLYYAAIRESLTNAVRHADADQLYVKTWESDNCCLMEITDNGKPIQTPIVEGTGLQTLRNQLQQSGASMMIDCEQHVKISIKIPLPEKRQL